MKDIVVVAAVACAAYASHKITKELVVIGLREVMTTEEAAEFNRRFAAQKK